MTTKEKVVIGILETVTVIAAIGTVVIYKRLFDFEKGK